jgi:hypothetical protein
MSIYSNPLIDWKSLIDNESLETISLRMFKFRSEENVFELAQNKFKNKKKLEIDVRLSDIEIKFTSLINMLERVHPNELLILS